MAWSGLPPRIMPSSMQRSLSGGDDGWAAAIRAKERKGGARSEDTAVGHDEPVANSSVASAAEEHGGLVGTEAAKIPVGSPLIPAGGPPYVMSRSAPWLPPSGLATPRWIRFPGQVGPRRGFGPGIPPHMRPGRIGVPLPVVARLESDRRVRRRIAPPSHRLPAKAAATDLPSTKSDEAKHLMDELRQIEAEMEALRNHASHPPITSITPTNTTNNTNQSPPPSQAEELTESSTPAPTTPTPNPALASPNSPSTISKP
mmetsp:Transcript_4474/g.8900  ORF Transcript_4474/g.8900 Transcript_4474/m.8900 type:complete len:258 (-) Transcript_4474:141-914(-)